MEKNKAVFSISTQSGWTNVVFEKDHTGKIETKVRFFDDKGNQLQDEFGDGGVLIEEVTQVAKFMEGMKEMRLEDYSK